VQSNTTKHLSTIRLRGAVNNKSYCAVIIRVVTNKYVISVTEREGEREGERKK
jgi:riboflavin synthase